MDRSTILDGRDNLLFTRCPFTGKQLSSQVYPVQEKKEQIKQFRMKRNTIITQIAQRLLLLMAPAPAPEEKRFESFHNVLDAVEIYLKGNDENYLPLVRELTAIWCGNRNPPSTVLLVDRLEATSRPDGDGDGDAGDAGDGGDGDGSEWTWTTAVESGRIEKKVYKILVSAETFKDESRGSHNRSCCLALALFDDAGEVVERCKLFDGPSPYSSSSSNTRSKPYPFCVFGKQDRIVANAKVGYTYKLQYMIGSSPQYVQVEGIVCKIIPSIDSVTSYRMRDADGEEGLYIGSINSDRFAHGEGSLEYEDGKSFVGMFKNGSMVDGVLYRGSQIRHTLKRGKWTKSIDEVLVEKYPSNVIVYDHARSFPKTKIRVDSETPGDYSLVRRNDRDDQFDDMRHRTTNRGRHDGQNGSLDDNEIPYSTKSLLDDEISLE